MGVQQFEDDSNWRQNGMVDYTFHERASGCAKVGVGAVKVWEPIRHPRRTGRHRRLVMRYWTREKSRVEGGRRESEDPAYDIHALVRKEKSGLILICNRVAWVL
jgi:hypothetical protein